MCPPLSKRPYELPLGRLLSRAQIHDESESSSKLLASLRMRYQTSTRRHADSGASMLGLRGRTAWQFIIHQASTRRRDTANIQKIQYTELGSIPHPSYMRGDLNTAVARRMRTMPKASRTTRRTTVPTFRCVTTLESRQRPCLHIEVRSHVHWQLRQASGLTDG